MANIVSQRSRPVVDESSSVLSSYGMAYGENLYDDSYDDHSETFIQSKFQSDDGSVPQVIDESSSDLVAAAKEFSKNRRPIYDWKTSNKSFIEVHNDLKRLGIKHNKFFLILYDRDLQGVDPFDRLLPLDMQIKVYLECVINPWYYLREIARVPSQGKPIEPGGGDQFILDRNNLATWHLFINNIDHYGSKPRQCGKTQDALHKVNYSYHFGSTSSSTLLFNKDLALSKENLARLKDQRDLYPTYLQMRVAFDEETGGIVKGIDNITMMKNPVTGNSIKVMPSANSKEMATRIGRGYTAPVMAYDEVDFEAFQMETIFASAFAYSTASKNAIENGSCACRIFTSTPGDLSTRDGKAMTDFIRGTKEQKGMLVWNDRMFDEPIEDIKKLVQSPAYNGVVFVEHNWRQLKRPMEWYERQCSLCAYNQEQILREIQLQRLAGSNMSPFTREQQLYLSSHKRRPIKEIDVKTRDTLSTIYVYEKLDRRIPYIMGIDPSEGLAGDNNAMIIVNPFTYKVAVEYKCPYISPKDFAAAIVNFMDTYMPRGLLVVESNRGRALLQYLTDSHYASRVWYDADRMNHLLSEKTDKYGGIPQSVLARKVQGFVTGPKSRLLLFTCLEEMVNENIDCIFSENLVNELLTLIRKPNTGKIEAAEGEHDDCVMAYLIGLYVYLHASNLAEFGISRTMRKPDEEFKPVVETEQDYRARVRSALDSLPEEYRGIFEDFVNQKDPTTDARQYAREMARAQENDPRRQRMTMQEFDNETNISFDHNMGQRDDAIKIGMPNYRPMGYQHQNYYNRQAPEDSIMLNGDAGSGADMMSEHEREAYENSIFRMNFQPNGVLDPGGDQGIWSTYQGDPDDIDDFTGRY